MKIEIPETKKFVYEMLIPIRWGDMDMMGHVNNCSYFRYLEVIRVDWTRSIGAMPDPKGDGTGGPGYSIPDEMTGDIKPEVGTLAMANAGPNSGGSQFFVCQMPQPHLAGRYTIFGRMTSGFDVLTRIEKGDPILDVKISEIKKP